MLNIQYLCYIDQNNIHNEDSPITKIAGLLKTSGPTLPEYGYSVYRSRSGVQDLGCQLWSTYSPDCDASVQTTRVAVCFNLSQIPRLCWHRCLSWSKMHAYHFKPFRWVLILKPVIQVKSTSICHGNLFCRRRFRPYQTDQPHAIQCLRLLHERPNICNCCILATIIEPYLEPFVVLTNDGKSEEKKRSKSYTNHKQSVCDGTSSMDNTGAYYSWAYYLLLWIIVYLIVFFLPLFFSDCKKGTNRIRE